MAKKEINYNDLTAINKMRLAQDSTTYNSNNPRTDYNRNPLNTNNIIKGHHLSYSELNTLYSQQWVIRRILDCYVDMGLKLDCWNIKSNSIDNALIMKAKDYFLENAHQSFKEFLRYKLGFGGSLFVIKNVKDDGISSLEEELNPLGTLKFTAYTPQDAIIIPDTTQDNEPLDFTKVSYYSIRGFICDPSRAIKGIYIVPPLLDRPLFRYYGVSISQNILPELIGDMILSKSSAFLVQNMSRNKVKIKGFKSAVAKGQHDEILNYIRSMTETGDILKTMVMDEEDDFLIMSQSLNDLSSLSQRALQRVAGASGLSATVLLGKSPDGQNSTGASDLEITYNSINSFQHNHIQNDLKQVFKIIFKNITNDVNFEEDFSIDFNQVKMLSKQEQIESKLKGLELIEKGQEVLGWDDKTIQQMAQDLGVIEEPYMRGDEDFNPKEIEQQTEKEDDKNTI